MHALIKFVGREDFSASLCEAKIKKLDKLRRVSAGAMRDLQDSSLANKINDQGIFENNDFTQGKSTKRFSNGSCSGSDDSDCYVVPSRNLSKESSSDSRVKYDSENLHLLIIHLPT
ncbi:hypothetical protein QAD02_006614 [Eretmocerus hayati]|uniref:Uncharacterized protein n=1 Tax=Eretmocerus hayati TaxID=131215 RepID=A0ACC2N1F6_9HYME|nr:hypothetical protein QAD02_006614 [Eretmocerus hayati]